jgi:hypothetical protein
VDCAAGMYAIGMLRAFPFVEGCRLPENNLGMDFGLPR